MSLANGLSILFILSKNQLLVLLIFAMVSFVSFAFISALTLYYTTPSTTTCTELFTKSMKSLGVMNLGSLTQDNMQCPTALFLMVSDRKLPQSSSIGDYLSKACTSTQWNTIQRS